MAKSQTTFSKKEKEKSRIARRVEKEEKKEERKANSNKGKGLESMLAYIDENGNISATPPDASRRIEIKSEDIQIGIPKRVDADPAELVRTGVITMFNSSKGFGFIKDSVSQESVFVHINELDGPVKEKDKVVFEVQNGHKGLSAIKVRKL
ncbi:MAG TPA: cold shock domain-containing protein [Segetibacter sp.]